MVEKIKVIEHVLNAFNMFKHALKTLPYKHPNPPGFYLVLSGIVFFSQDFAYLKKLKLLSYHFSLYTYIY